MFYSEDEFEDIEPDDEGMIPHLDGGSSVEAGRGLNIRFHEDEEHPRIGIAILSGEINAYNSKEFRTSMLVFADDNHPFLVCDFTKLEYISSAGIGSLVGLVDEIESEYDGRMILFGIQPAVQEVFNLLGFNAFFTILERGEDALKEAHELQD